MKILFATEVPFEKQFHCWNRDIKLDASGLFMIEQPPTERIISTNTNSGFTKLSFPYIKFIFGYSTFQLNGVKKYTHYGCYDGGMRVFYSTTQSLSLDCNVNVAWTDRLTNGLVCTPHHFDYNLNFDSIYDLGNNYLDLYWSIRHEIPISWKNNPHDLEKVFKETRMMTLENAYDNTFLSPLRRNDLFQHTANFNDLRKSPLINQNWSRNWNKSPIEQSVLNLQNAIRK